MKGMVEYTSNLAPVNDRNNRKSANGLVSTLEFAQED